MRKQMGMTSNSLVLNEDPNIPKRFFEEAKNKIDNKDSVKGTQWYDEY